MGISYDGLNLQLVGVGRLGACRLIPMQVY